MSEITTTENNQNTDWKPQAYVFGTLIGAGMGFLASYLFARAADEDPENAGERPALQTAQLFSLVLAAIGLLRQISEMGKNPKKKDK